MNANSVYRETPPYQMAGKSSSSRSQNNRSLEEYVQNYPPAPPKVPAMSLNLSSLALPLRKAPAITTLDLNRQVNKDLKNKPWTSLKRITSNMKAQPLGSMNKINKSNDELGKANRSGDDSHER